ncbi:Small nuclear ribonucleoprotein Sm D3 [Lachnellula cervina]|uniref:Small nuclear ribonucleoprotein Sm D3 n=1 Tax=Lachnellula cervina TaxID=1316786 RepID=A0A7D8URL4_9HELO|nr:Small nuclear ribonucleoprotein Sm D3 [Lachnellula cervina]
MTSTIGIPIKLLNEAQGHVVTLEITSGQVYRGKLLEGSSFHIPQCILLEIYQIGTEALTWTNHS